MKDDLGPKTNIPDQVAKCLTQEIVVQLALLLMSVELDDQ